MDVASGVYCGVDVGMVFKKILGTRINLYGTQRKTIVRSVRKGKFPKSGGRKLQRFGLTRQGTYAPRSCTKFSVKLLHVLYESVRC